MTPADADTIRRSWTGRRTDTGEPAADCRVCGADVVLPTWSPSWVHADHGWANHDAVAGDPDSSPRWSPTVGQLGLTDRADPELGPDAARWTPPAGPAALQLTPLDADGQPTTWGPWLDVTVTAQPDPDPAVVFARACAERGRVMYDAAARAWGRQ